MAIKEKKSEVLIITGPSGAGKTTAINVLEDLGFETIDNIPIELIYRVLSGPDLVRSLAIGIDVRTRGFSAQNLNNAILDWGKNDGLDVSLLYLDCMKDVLEQRFNKTRRRHPLSIRDTLHNAILKEDKIINSLRRTAEILIDTTQLSPHELREELFSFFDRDGDRNMVLSIHSFSYQRAVPAGIDMVFDCRFLRNPHWVSSLRSLNGMDTRVAEHIKADENWDEFLRKIVDLLEFLIPRHQKEGKYYFSIGFGCSGGQHRSVFASEAVAETLRSKGWPITIRHREIKDK